MENKLTIHVKLSKTISSRENYQIVVFNAISKEIKTSSFIAAGEIPKLTKNEELIIIGEFIKKNGKQQFNVSSWKRPTPDSKDQIIKFFSSSLFKGIGKKTASNIYNALGKNAISKINNEGIIALENISGLSKEKAAVIALITQQTFLLNDLIEQYQKFGVSSGIILKAHSKLGNKIIELKTNPYLLAYFNLIHFNTSDEIGKKMNILPHAKIRLETALYLYLKEVCLMHGHCYVDENELINKCLEFLNSQISDKGDAVHPMSFIAMMEESKHCYVEENRVYPINLYNAEKDVADKLHQLTLSSNNYQSLKISKAISAIEEQYQITLSSEQKQAIHELTKENLLFLTGGPGTGKTFTVSAILKVYKKLFPHHTVSLAAPTGRAAKRLGEVTGMGSHAQTLHRLLGISYNGLESSQLKTESSLESDFIIVDEFSMSDIELTKHLFNAIKLGTKVLIVGDPDQLPSVGPGNVLKDCLEAGLPQIHLTTIFRQAQNSKIVKNAHKINAGQMISLENTKEHYFIECNSLERTSNLIAHSVKKLIQKGNKLSDIMVLSPMKQGQTGIYQLNKKIQELINPKEDTKKEMTYKGAIYRVGDKVMYLVNNKDKDIFNGDIGIILNIKTSDGIVTIGFEGNIVELDKEEWKNIQLSYCLTIHKSQGNQSKINILCLTNEHQIMLTRNLFYTGITRTEEMFILIGSLAAIERAIQTNRVKNRKTGLKERLLNKRKYITKYPNIKTS